MASDRQADFLLGGGEMGERMRAFDWTSNPLGPPALWPRSLKTAVRIMLTSRQAIWIGWGPELIYLYNDPYKSIIGGKHPEALGQPASVVWREIWSEVGPRIDRVMRDDEGTYDEALLLIMERSGYPEETYYTFSYSPIPDDDGGVGGLICANTADTERVLRERHLALLQKLGADASNARTVAQACAMSATSLASDAHDFPFAGIYLPDPAHGDSMLLAGVAGIDAGHPAMPPSIRLDDASTWPLTAASSGGSAVFVENIDRAGPLPRGAWDRPPRHGVVVPIAAAGRTGNAGFLVAALNPYRLFDESYRNFIEMVASRIAATVANAQAYEDEARRAAALAELDRAKTAFFSNVSHEFRTPLTLMLGPLEEAVTAPAQSLAGDDLATVHRNARRLLKLVNTLLEFSRIEAGRTSAHYEETDVAALTRDLASAFRSAMEKAGLRFIVDVEPVEAPVFVDPEMWEKIVLNLLSNAFKFTLAGEIEVRLRAGDTSFTLVVRDTGSGIPASHLPHIFERFHRVEGTKGRTHEGSGIGLAFVQELVRLHGGSVSAASVEGEGTAFTVTIPLGSAHLPKERITPRRAAGTARTADLFLEETTQWLFDDGREATPPPQPTTAEARPRILLADDNPDMRDYIARLLAPTYEVVAVKDGAEALREASANSPDLVIADIMMPNLDGFGLLSALRASTSTATIPVLLLSARAGDEARIEGFTAGADDYMVKPFAARELLARVSGLLALARVRREAEEALREVFVKAPAVIATVRGPEHVFHVANPLYMQLIGEHREVIGKPVREALPELEGQGFFELLDRVYETGEAVVGREMVCQLDRGSGLEEFYFDFVYQPLHDANGRVTGIFAHGVDVTTQVRAREEVREMADLSPQAVWLADATGRNIHVNRWWTDFTGLDADASAGHGWLAVIHPDDRAQITSRWADALARERPFEDEIRLRRHDGTHRWHLTRAVPRKDASGRVVSWIGVAADIDDIRRAQEALREADRMKDEFLATLSHELRTPLTAILGWTQILGADQVFGADGRHELLDTAIETITRSARAQARLIEDVLDVSRVTTGKMRLERSPASLPPVIEAAVETVRPAAEAKEIALRVSLDTRIGPILMDPDRMQQVFWNLLSNAIKFSPANTTIDVSLHRAANHAIIEVRDEGPGIPADFLPHMFERFRQADSSSRRTHSGLGLGLALVKDLTELHGGRVEVETAEGHGTVFRVRLPLRVDVPRAQAARRAETLNDGSLAGAAVLLVDDSADARVMFGKMIESHGAAVKTAGTVDEALAILSASLPDLVITDIAMPDRDGYDLLRAIRSIPGGQTLPVLALTAQAREGDEENAFAAGFQAYLRKPIDAADLALHIARHLQ